MEHSHRGLLSPRVPFGRRLSGGWPGRGAARTARRPQALGAVRGPWVPPGSTDCLRARRPLLEACRKRTIVNFCVVFCLCTYVCPVELRPFCPSGMHHPFPRAEESGDRRGLSSAGSTEKEAAERAGAGEFPFRARGRKGLYTHPSHESSPRSGAGSGISSQDFLRLEGFSLEQRPVLFRSPHLCISLKQLLYPVITLGKGNLSGSCLPHRGEKKKLDALHRRVQAWKYGVYRE